jgi:hypothetical protein
MDLVKSMIFSANKNKYFSNTRLLRDALEKLVMQQWLSFYREEDGVEDGDQRINICNFSSYVDEM